MDEEVIKDHISKIIMIITDKLYDQKQSTPKVIWNICVAISKIIDTFNEVNNIQIGDDNQFIDYSCTYVARIFYFETTKCFLNIFMDGQNFKTKIHACQTLMKYKNLNQYGYSQANLNPENLLEIFWMHIQDQLKYQINMNVVASSGMNNQSGQEQKAYIEQIDKSFIQFWAHVCSLTRQNLSNPTGQADQEQILEKDGTSHQNTMIEYFNNNAYDLLQSIIKYLARELKIPEYTQMFDVDEGEFDQETFDKETEQIFKDNPQLFEKLQLIKTQIISKIFEILDKDSQVRVSLLVYTNFNKLANSDVLTEYRSMEILRVKSNFNPNRT